MQHLQTLPRYLNQNSSSRGCTPNPLTGAAFADTPLVLAPKQCFTWVHAKSADRRRVCRHSVDICAKAVFHASARQIGLRCSILGRCGGTCARIRHSVCTFANTVSCWCAPNLVDTSSISRHSVATCVTTVFHVGLRQIR